MAELAFGIIGNVLQKLGSVVYQELSLAQGINSNLKRLECTLSIIREVLLDAEKKQVSDPLLRLWLGQLNDVLHDAEDVFDEIEYQALRNQVVATHGSTSIKVRHSFSSSMTRAFPFKLAHKIEGIRERLDEIAADKDKFNLTQQREDGRIMHRVREIDLISFVHPSKVIGRDKEKKKIINLLMHSDVSKNVSVISIVGLGGLGKTTLAKWVYNDERVVKTFQLRMWICVSEDFSVTRLISEILKSAYSASKITIDHNWSVDELQTKLREFLKDKKFLLVLDDVWNEDRNKWIELRNLLIDGSEGSKIIVTTRTDLVASVMCIDSTYNLEGLSQDDCLSLFVKCAFKEGEKKQHPNLLKIGKEIVKKCKGVPLAVSTLGSQLHSKVDEREWEFVRDNEIWKLKQKENDILPALRISFDQLPIHLKRCFAFCSFFPKDHEFYSDELIQMWMAHGLILEMSINDKQELEYVEELYINELVSRSFFQNVEKEIPSLPFYTFQIHDLIRDLAISVAIGEYCSEVDFDAKDITRTIRHLSFSTKEYLGQEVQKCLDKFTKVHTVMFTTEQPVSLVEACFSRFKSLRLLDLNNSSFEVLPSSISTLKHLRYIDLSGNRRIKELPNSICNLHHLQTLLLGGCSELERLPKDMRNMISLRSLVMTTKSTWLLENGSLNSLRFLVLTDCPRLEVLFQGMDGCLTNLRMLIINSCARLASLPLNIKHLTALEELFIYDCKELVLMGENNQDLKLNLRTLVIYELRKLKVLPLWIQGSAKTLQCLRIEECKNFTALPEWLPTLKSLHTLEIISCPKLSSLPKETHCLTALRSLKIEFCYELSRKCRGEDQPKIAHVPEVELDDDVIVKYYLENFEDFMYLYFPKEDDVEGQDNS